MISEGSIRGTEELIILTMMGDGDQISVGMGRMGPLRIQAGRVGDDLQDRGRC